MNEYTTIPYTQNIEEMLQYLARFGHKLIHIPKQPVGAFRFKYFKCSVCEIDMRLQEVWDHSYWGVFVGGGLKGSHYYCEKYRLLY